MPVGDKLRILRGSVTVQAVAKVFGVSQPTWTTWELGTRSPSLEAVAEICRHFNVSADWLLGLSDEKNAGVTVKAEKSSVAINGNANTVHGNCAECPLMKAASKVVGGKGKRGKQ